MTVEQDGALRLARNADVDLAVRVQGGGPPVLLVHGSWEDHATWDSVACRLSATRRVIAYDRRGHSASSRPPGQGRIGEDVEDAAFVLEELAGVPAVVVGHSYGGTVALLLAAVHPELVARLVVHEPPLFGLLAADPAWAVPLDAARRAMAAAADALVAGDIESGVRTFVDNVAFGPGAWTELFDDRGRHVALANWSTWLDQHRDPDRLAIDAELAARITVPTLVSTGAASLPWYPEIARRLVAALPAARLVTLDGVGHGAHHARPELIAALVD